MAIHGETKITITLQLNEDYGSADDMATALLQLQRLGITPLGKVQLTFDKLDPVAAEETEIRLEAVLQDVPRGVDVTVKTSTERGVERRKMDGVMPMDKYLKN
jgi:hypothetical protein